MNLCGGCGLDFGSVSGFDAHRVGRHAYTYLQGLDQTPPVEDGRRCLDPDELAERGWRQDTRGRWRQPARVDAPVGFMYRAYGAAKATVATGLVLAGLALVGVSSATAGEGSWWPDGVVCYPTGRTVECRYVAPGCELVRVMDDQGPGLSGSRRVLFCRAPRGAE